MKLLLMSGLGPYTANSHSLDATLFAENGARELRDDYVQIAGRPIDLAALRYGGKSGYPLLRPYHGSMPHLPMEALRSINIRPKSSPPRKGLFKVITGGVVSTMVTLRVAVTS